MIYCPNLQTQQFLDVLLTQRFLVFTYTWAARQFNLRVYLQGGLGGGCTVHYLDITEDLRHQGHVYRASEGPLPSWGTPFMGILLLWWDILCWLWNLNNPADESRKLFHWLMNICRFTLRGSASDKSTKEAEKYSFKLVAEDAVDDEVNGTVYGDQEVISLCQRVILMSKMLQYPSFIISIIYPHWRRAYVLAPLTISRE